MTKIKLPELMTPVGLLRVGDTVKLDFEPSNVRNQMGRDRDTQKVFAIWKDGSHHSLAFDNLGIDDSGHTWNGGGNIRTHIKKIIPLKIDNWRLALK